MATEVCEYCLQAKQHTLNFSKDAGSKTKFQLEVVFSDVCPLEFRAMCSRSFRTPSRPPLKKERIYFEDVFSPVSRIKTIRLVVALETMNIMVNVSDG